MAAKNTKNILSFNSPANWWGAMWRDALPTGNGTVGASVYGGAGDEVILLNHSHLTWQGNAGVLPDVSDKAEEERKLIEKGNFAKAERVLSDALITKGYRPQPGLPLPLCDIKVHQDFDKPVKEYSRSVNMDTGEVTVSYKDGVTRYDRRLFVSRANDMVIYEIDKTGTKNIDMTFSVDLHDRTNVRTPVAVSELPENPSSRYEKYFMYFAARSDSAADFGMVARINIFGGSMESNGGGITVKGAEKILIIIKTFVESARDKEWKALRAELSANKLTYEKMLKEHVTLHAKLFETATLEMGEDKEDSLDAALTRARHDGMIEPPLFAKLWTFGRYLFVCSTSANGSVMRPYGLWCGDYKAVESYSDAGGGLQLLYAHAFGGGLADFLLPIFDEYETVLDELKKNATRLYNCRGIFIPAVVAPASGLLGSVNPSVIHTVWIAASVAVMMYEYALYTQDKKFLKTRALPFMREAALFYDEFFKVKMDGKYESSPSYSFGNTPIGMTPDNVPLAVAKNSNIDFSAVRELLNDLIAVGKECGAREADIEKWTAMLSKIPSAVIEGDGLVKEYLDTRLTDNYDSASVNMLYGVYPGRGENLADPELKKACLATAKKRAVAGIRRHDSASFIRLAGVFARLGEGNDCADALTTMIRTFVGGNGLISGSAYTGMGIGAQDFWATFGLYGNMGLVDVMQEMLIQTDENNIRLLPAIPSAWQKGTVEGLSTRFGAEVDMTWDTNRRMATTVRIKSRKARTVTVIFPEGTVKVKGIKVFDAESRCAQVELAAGKAVTLVF